jgi:aromatic-L-amino-acid decarboxylase
VGAAGTVALCSLLFRSREAGAAAADEVSGAEDGENFVHAGRYLLQWIVDYRSKIAPSLPVISRVQPNAIATALPPEAPVKPEPWSAVYSDLTKVVLPGLTHWESSSKFFAYFKPHSSYPAVLGELLCAGLNVRLSSFISLFHNSM